MGKPRMALTDAPRKKTCTRERTDLTITDLTFNFSQEVKKRAQSPDCGWVMTEFKPV